MASKLVRPAAAAADTAPRKGAAAIKDTPVSRCCDWCGCVGSASDMHYCKRCEACVYCDEVCASGHWGPGGHCRVCKPAATHAAGAAEHRK